LFSPYPCFSLSKFLVTGILADLAAAETSGFKAARFLMFAMADITDDLEGQALQHRLFV
jgi:hypothetical protein